MASRSARLRSTSSGSRTTTASSSPAEPVGEFVNDQVNGVTFLYVDEDEEEARTWGTKLVYTFSHLAAHLIGISNVYPTSAYKTPGLLFAIRTPAQERAPGGGGAIREGMAVGTPDRVIAQIKLWEEIGVDRMVFILNTAEQIPQEKVLNSLRLFAEKVMPAFEKDATTPAEPTKAARPRRSPHALLAVPEYGRLGQDTLAHTSPALAPLYPPPPGP